MHAPPSPELANSGLVPFNWEDPFDLESQLTEDERMIRDTARDYAQEKLLTRVRQAYRDATNELFGLRFKTRLLPKVSVSFPVRENQVLFFNYGHSTRVPHPSFVYAGLNPFFQDRSFLSRLGNPNLDPEVDISYEIGLRNQITSNDALNVSAFWRDKFDFITSSTIVIEDATGQETERSFRVNGDFARVRGVEATYIKRYKDWVQGQLSVTFSRAEGLSSTTDEALQNVLVGGQNAGNNIETPLAWDRPWDIKGSVTFTYDRREPLFGFGPLNKMKLFISSTWRSGVRYTPVIFRGFEINPFTGEQDWRPIYDTDPNPENRFSEVGSPWFYIDMNFQKWFTVGETRFSAFLEITNLLNRNNAILINPVTGESFQEYPTSQAALLTLRNNRAYDVPTGTRDPRFRDPQDRGLPSFANPANFLQQRHVMVGLSVNL